MRIIFRLTKLNFDKKIDENSELEKIFISIKNDLLNKNEMLVDKILERNKFKPVS